MMPRMYEWKICGLIPGLSTRGRGAELYLVVSQRETVSLRTTSWMLSKEYVESVLFLSSLGPRAEMATEIESCTPFEAIIELQSVWTECSQSEDPGYISR